MTGNCHVRFLGDKGGVIRLSYPTKDNPMNNISESFNEDFCTHLERHLCDTFIKSKQRDLNSFWCDGISWDPIPDSQLLKKSVNDTRKIVTTSWIGIDGQDEYEMTIKFGKYSLRRYASGANLIGCIPDSSSMDWITIDTNNKTIELRLK